MTFDTLDDVTSHSADKYTLGEWKSLCASVGLVIISDASKRPETDVLTAKEFNTLVKEECIFEHRKVAEPELVEPPPLEERIKNRQALIATRGSTPTQVTSETDHGSFIVPITDTIREILAPAVQEPVRRSTRSPYVEDPKPSYPLRGIVKGTMRSGETKIQDVLGWQRAFNEFRRKVPIGQYITTEDGSPIRINIECVLGQTPFMSTRIYLSNIVGAPLKWYAARENDNSSAGWLFILHPKCRDAAMLIFDMEKPYALVREIRVDKTTSSGMSLLGEITQYE